MLVKICGITRPEDAEAAVAAGADAIGFIFWPKSPRFIDPSSRARDRGGAAAVCDGGRRLRQPAAGVRERRGEPGGAGRGAAARRRDAGVRRHGVAAGDEGRLPSGADEARLWPSRVRLLLDVHDPVARGGTGRTIDWTAAADLAARREVLLAGGLTPDNVADAVARVRPFGIDVSSGVERAPGIKDHERLRALFEAVHDAGHITTRP